MKWNALILHFQHLPERSLLSFSAKMHCGSVNCSVYVCVCVCAVRAHHDDCVYKIAICKSKSAYWTITFVDRTRANKQRLIWWTQHAWMLFFCNFNANDWHEYEKFCLFKRSNTVTKCSPQSIVLIRFADHLHQYCMWNVIEYQNYCAK